MSDSDGEADALGRLEAALDRIAVGAEAGRNAGPPVDVQAIKARLDRLIGQLRDALPDPTAEA